MLEKAKQLASQEFSRLSGREIKQDPAKLESSC